MEDQKAKEREKAREEWDAFFKEKKLNINAIIEELTTKYKFPTKL